MSSVTIGATASVIDRLIDDDPETSTEPRPLRVVGERMLRASVRRELLRLLNTRSNVPWDEWGDRPRTVLDYGVPDFTWMSPASQPDRARLGAMLEACIAAFEPRLKRAAVTLVPAGDPRSLAVTIDARLVVGSVDEPVSFPIVIRGDGMILCLEEEDG